jgi:hypothetical protein
MPSRAIYDYNGVKTALVWREEFEISSWHAQATLEGCEVGDNERKDRI